MLKVVVSLKGARGTAELCVVVSPQSLRRLGFMRWGLQMGSEHEDAMLQGVVRSAERSRG